MPGGVGIDTKWRFSSKKPNWTVPPSGRIDGGGLDQHDWDSVLNGVHTAALSTSQALTVRTENDRLLAHWADQHFQ